MTRPREFACYLAVALSLQSTAALSDQDTLEEVVVTAQKREQNLQDVGVAVTAMSAEEVRQLGISDGKDIAKMVPGVVFASTAGGSIASNLTIRGVSQSDYSATQESPNSIYLDEIYLASPNAANFQFYDTERVEVLRGPQGTLFGRSSSGGLLNYFTKRPSREFEGFAEVGFGAYQQKYLEAAAGGPLTDNVRGRLSARLEQTHGWFQNTAPGGKDTFETRFFGVRGQLEADLSDRLSARFSMSYDRTPRERAGTYVVYPAYLVNGHPAFLPADVDAYGTGPGNDFSGYRSTGEPLKAPFNNVGFFESQKVSPTLYLNYDGGGYKIASITNYTKFNLDYAEDCDGTPVNLCVFPIKQNLKQFSQELRVFGTSGRLTWTAGVYLLNVQQDVVQSFQFPVYSGTSFAFSDDNVLNQKLFSYSAFNQLEWAFTPKLTGILGLRYTHDRKTFDSKVLITELGSASGGTGVYDPPLVAYDFSEATVGNLAKQSVGMISGKAELDFRPVDDVLIYGSISRGVKGPGFNTNVGATLTTEATPFKDEWLIAYEIGSKLEFFDHRLRLNSDVYYYDRHRAQEYAYSGFSALVSNYEGKHRGAEIELTAVPMDKLTIALSASFMETSLYNVGTAYSGIQTQQGVMAPRRMWNGYVRKGFNLGAGELSVQWSFDFVGDRYASVDNNLATFVPGSFEHNARVVYTLPNSGLEIAARLDNISDKRRINYSFDTLSYLGSITPSMDKPRWWGISVRKTF
jgi:iron complex outermembrane recepter protein